MKRTEGTNVKVDTDSTGGMVSVDWCCPYCDSMNFGFYFSSNAGVMSNDFEIDHECDTCGKMVTIECRDASTLF